MLIVGSLTGNWQFLSPTKEMEPDPAKIVIRYTYYMLIMRKQLDWEIF